MLSIQGLRGGGPEVAKNGQNYLKEFFMHEIHQNRGFWGQGCQKAYQNTVCPRTHKSYISF